MNGGPNRIPDPPPKDWRLAEERRNRPTWRPDHEDGQLTLMSIAMAGEPTGEANDDRAQPEKIPPEIVALGEMVTKTSIGLEDQEIE